jgi:hypothetical protein
LRHHAGGIFPVEKLFGVAIANSDGKQISVHSVGEEHVREDPGAFPQSKIGSSGSSRSAACMGSGWMTKRRQPGMSRHELLPRNIILLAPRSEDAKYTLALDI